MLKKQLNEAAEGNEAMKELMKRNEELDGLGNT